MIEAMAGYACRSTFRSTFRSTRIFEDRTAKNLRFMFFSSRMSSPRSSQSVNPERSVPLKCVLRSICIMQFLEKPSPEPHDPESQRSLEANTIFERHHKNGQQENSSSDPLYESTHAEIQSNRKVTHSAGPLSVEHGVAWSTKTENANAVSIPQSPAQSASDQRYTPE